MESLTPKRRERVAGIGVGLPFDLWNWLESVGAPDDEMEAWKTFSVRDALAEVTNLPVFVGNDSSLACHGEHLFGAAAGFADFAHIYMGAFVGGGIVVGNRLYLGQGGNAGAIGSIPVARRDGSVSQLLEAASVNDLERRLDAHAAGAGQKLLQSRNWEGFEDLLGEWVDETAWFLAYAAVVLVSVLDVPVVVVDGSFPPRVRTALVDRMRSRLARMDKRGIRPPTIVAGNLGTMACALGAGYQPIVARYLVD
jgi:predicted NBD/HSP70 family sugar kinase